MFSVCCEAHPFGCQAGPGQYLKRSCELSLGDAYTVAAPLPRQHLWSSQNGAGDSGTLQNRCGTLGIGQGSANNIITETEHMVVPFTNG